jgi:hypothetical protein
LKLHIFFVPLLFATTATVAAHGQQQRTHDGFWWTDSTEQFRTGFVTGYVMAMVTVSDANTFKCLAERNGGKVPEKFPGMEAFDACAESARVEAFDLGGFRVGQWSDGIDAFYRDFRNRGLEIHLAIRYVRGQLRGQPAKELEDEVTEWRRTAAPK